MLIFVSQRFHKLGYFLIIRFSNFEASDSCQLSFEIFSLSLRTFSEAYSSFSEIFVPSFEIFGRLGFIIKKFGSSDLKLTQLEKTSNAVWKLYHSCNGLLFCPNAFAEFRPAWMTRTKDGLLNKLDCNVILVHWSKGSLPPYVQATGNTRLVGAMIA